MKLFTILIFFFGFVSTLSAQVTQPAVADTSGNVTLVYIVRHADRAGSADSLTESGIVRSQELKRVLSQVNLWKIYSTNTNRTKNTARPTADARGLPVEIYADNTNLISKLDQTRASLVIGHSNTLGDLIRKCGCNPPASLNALPETQYDNLFLVMLTKVVKDGKTTTRCDYQQLKYGVSTN